MKTLLFIFLQSGMPDGLPDPDEFGNPDALPVNQDLPILLAAGVALAIYMLWLRPRLKKSK